MAPSTAAKGAVRATGGAAAKGAVRATGDAAVKGASQATGGATMKGAVRAIGGATAKGAERATGGAAPGAVAASTAGAQILKAAGFTKVGPAADSFAASWMSTTANANGGGVPVGSLYSAVQATAMGGGLKLAAPAVKTVGAVSGAGAVNCLFFTSK